MRGAASYLILLVTIAASIGSPLSPPIDASIDLFEPRSLEIAPRAAPEDYRLNDDVLPSHYDIEITPYFQDEGDHKAFSFTGTAVITIRPTKAGVQSIKLHKRNIDIISWTLMNPTNSAVIPTGEAVFVEETDMLTLPVNTALIVETDYQLTFNYVGYMEDNMRGFYRSYYYENGEKVWMGSTQFQTTDARRAFPCFDEPSFKATFQVKINRPAAYKAFSNTVISNSIDLPSGRVQEIFHITPVMSTYLIAFIVADYRVNEKNGMGILARPEAMNQTDYSLNSGIDILKALEEFIDFPFTSVPEMTRMYMAAVPDFSAGAMENWGLLTYRETNILYRNDDSTSLQQQRIAAVIAHEIAHQWFGDLVTCQWWDATWLNEGFARYFQYFGTAMIEPNWNLEDQFVVEQLQGAMQMDSLESTHPMTHYVYTPAQISGIFDNISYNKGGVTLRMVEHILSTATFRNALRAYIKKQAFKSSRPEDLFDSLVEFGGQSIRSFMEPWTTQSGYPLVTVATSDDGYSLVQRRFLVNDKNHSEQTTWPLPITYSTKAEDFAQTTPLIVSTKEHKISIENLNQLPYFILNNQQVGYYRVNYDAANWAKISAALRTENFGGIHVLNRAQIVDDLFNLARAGEVEYKAALEILDYLRDETEYAPWLAAVNGFTTLSRRIHPDDEEKFAKYMVQLFSNAYDMVKFQEPTADEKRVMTYLRINVLQFACNYGHEACKKAAADEFARFVANPSVKVHPDLRQIVYCEGIRQGTEEHFDFLWNQYLTTNVATEEILALIGLGCASNEELIFKMLDAVTSDSIRPQDKSAAFTYLLNNQYTLDYLSQYLRENYERWRLAHGSYLSVASAFNSILARAKTDEQMEHIRSFAVRNEAIFGSDAYSSIQGGVEVYAANKQFTEKHRVAIGEFLDEKVGSGATMITLSLSTFIAIVIGLLR